MLSETEKANRRLFSYGVFAGTTALYLLRDVQYFNAPLYPLLFNAAAAYYQTGTQDE